MISKKWLFIFIIFIIPIIFITGCAASGGSKPKTQVIDIYIGEKLAHPEDPLTKMLPETHDKLITEFYQWEPNVIVVFKGDTVKLQVTNPRDGVHSLVIPDLNLDTGSIKPNGGTATIDFVAAKAGTFTFKCGTPWDPTTDPENCEPDHEFQTGTLIILDR